MDGIMEATKGIMIIFILFLTVVVYTEYLLPKLSWSAWIITPAFILAMIGGIWSLMREDFIDKNEKEV